MNSNGGYILSLDCGTQSVRAILFDHKGNIVGKEKAEFEPYYSDEPGWAEQDPDVFWNNCCIACKELKSKQPIDWEKIIGVAVTTQRDTGIIVDKEGNNLAFYWFNSFKPNDESFAEKQTLLTNAKVDFTSSKITL